MNINLFKQRIIESNLDNHTSRELHNKIDQIRVGFGYPSLQVSIVIEGDRKFNCSTGFAHVEKKRKANVNTLYYLASGSKIYVKGLILKLVQEGFMGLDDYISKYMDVSPYGDDITLKQLLHHSSGLYDVTVMEDYKTSSLFLGKKWTEQEIINEARNNVPYFLPDSEHRYSNADYILLGKAAENATSKPYAQLIHDYIIKPLKIKKTSYSFNVNSPKGLSAGYDTHHYKSQHGGMVVNLDQFPVFLPSYAGFMSGGIIANSADFSSVMYNLFEGNLLDEKHKRLLRLFFGTKQFGGITLREQSGYLVGYKSFIGYSASRKFCIAVLSNISDDCLLDQTVEQIMDHLTNLELV